MCGILGASFRNNVIDKDRFKNALELLNHRGPNSTGLWFSQTSNDAFGFKRLSIIDLNERADQPLISLCGNYRIIFNGEIYNFKSLKKRLLDAGHSFNTKSDTEVLLNSYIEWGSSCLNKIDGMFAFAIYDLLEKRIFFARDLSGQKPFYYSFREGDLTFGSEIKTLAFLQPQKLRENAAYDFFSQGYVSSNQSIYENVEKLPPSHMMTFDLSTRELKISNYHNALLESEKPLSKYSENQKLESIKKLDHLIDQSVKNSLVSDVPIGILLSGGLDSSLIASYASKHKKHLKTFSVIFPSHQNYNEQYHSLKIADFLKTDHIEINAEDFSPKIIEDLSFHYDEPFADPSLIPTFMLSKEVKKHCTVALGGDGADELFGGYPSYDRKLILYKYGKNIPYFLRFLFFRSIAKIIPSNLRGYSILSSLANDFKKVTSSFDPLFFSKDIDNLLNLKKPLSLNEPSNTVYYDQLVRIQNFMHRLTLGDFYSFLSEDVLVKVDRASMAHSLEIRSPFLSKDIINFAFTELHSDFKIKNGRKKIILKSIAKNKLPNDFVYERKQGFSFPLRDLLYRDDWKEFFERKIKKFESNIINKSYALQLLQNHLSGRHCERKLFAIVQFICWYEKYIQPNERILWQKG
jgi:asparagine synthase (glutamine-hydrolysing)